VTTQTLDKEPVVVLCCPECKSQNIRARIDTKGQVNCVECYDCKFSDYYNTVEHRKHSDESQWKQMYEYSFKFYVTYHKEWVEEKVDAESDEQARKIAKANLGYDCYGYKRHSKVSVFINGVWETFT
jgi:hypothetical protein